MSRPRFLADHDLNEHIIDGVLRREPALFPAWSGSRSRKFDEKVSQCVRERSASTAPGCDRISREFAGIVIGNAKSVRK